MISFDICLCRPYLGFGNILTPPSTTIRRLLVALLPSCAVELWQSDDSTNRPSTAVVIDTLRFTTTASQALALGARSVHVSSTVEQAIQLANESPTRPLLCGERLCHPIEGFDLGNSPLELTRELVHGRDLVFTTTNGTLAARAVRHIPSVLLGALVNRRAVCQHLSELTTGDVLLVCAGTDGQVTWEDVLTAGAIIDELCRSENFHYGHDTARLAHAAWQAIEMSDTATLDSVLHATTSQNTGASSRSARLELELSRSIGGRNLIESGFQPDVHFAAQLDSLTAVAQNSKQHRQCFVNITQPALGSNS